MRSSEDNTQGGEFAEEAGGRGQEREEREMRRGECGGGQDGVRKQRRRKQTGAAEEGGNDTKTRPATRTPQNTSTFEGVRKITQGPSILKEDPSQMPSDLKEGPSKSHFLDEIPNKMG